MATVFKVEFEGFKETEELFRQIQKDFGAKDASNIMRNAVHKSMAPVLRMARSAVPKDTGALSASLQIETRRPSKKDQGSKYIQSTDVVIGLVTTASGKKLAKKSFKNIKTGQNQKYDYLVKNIKGKDVISSDQRASAMEFGTSKIAAKPYLRPALERSASTIVGDLGESLKFSLEKYKARQLKKVKT
jgi:hypothetical protein